MSTPATHLVVYTVDLNTMKKTLMAHFELHEDEVKATYKNMMFKSEMEEGIYTRGKTVKLKDGKEFMAALEANYSKSSTIVVERP